LAKRAAQSSINALRLDPLPGIALHRKIYRAILEAIFSAELAPGARLPSSRSLSAMLGVSRNSVSHAYDQLRAEGYLESRVGAGTYIAARVPESRLKKHFLRQQSNHSSEKLASLIARSGYPNQQEWFEDLEGNGLYLYTSR
jgi:DNA-binding GntR family transcriptional regulator